MEVTSTTLATTEQADDQLIRLVDVLQSIDAAQPLAQLNETTIADNNGGRIEL